LHTELKSRAEPLLGGVGSGDAIRLQRVSRTYRDRRGAGVHALADVSLRAGHGELLAVVGPSGCGKTTLLELICGLQRPDGGALAAVPAALMPQRDLLLPWLSALDNAALALRIARLPRARARARAAELFAELGLDGFESAHPYELSGGMRQRVAFLRTLLSGKPLLCLDEPFGALDAITRSEMQEWLANTLAREPRTVALVTHDVEEAIVLADRVAVLSPRPGRVLAELEVDLARPRARTDELVIALRERAIGLLQDGTRVATGGS
jgi:ABC-type nitrate/sulfonate/bicarbonate transport system ATPase subunit